ncbi:hypothetical protein MKX01_038431 [Papaver californicum]|nr:hypothetical protein MKX01_038431 [Papaver californicum]
MARILMSLVLIMMFLSQIAFAEDLKLGKKGVAEVERHGNVGQNLADEQVILSGDNNVVVAGGLVKAKRAGEVVTGLTNGNDAVSVVGGSSVEVAYGLVKTHDAENVGVNLLHGKTKAKDASAESLLLSRKGKVANKRSRKMNLPKSAP